MKKIFFIIFTLLLSLSFVYWVNSTYASATNLSGWDSIWWGTNRNSYIGDFQDSKFITFSSYTDKWVNDVLVMIARDMKNFFYAIASIYFLIIVLRLLVSSNTEEVKEQFKKWIIWITIWIIVMQMAFSFTTILFDNWSWWSLASSLSSNLINPIIKIMETLASVFFLAIAVFAFYRIVTANWNEEEIKRWKMAVLYAIVWFMIIRFARTLVASIYWNTNCTDSSSTCIWWANYSGATNIVVTVINWMNSFISIVIILMVVYAWFNLIFSAWDEEKLKKAKATIIYVIIWLVLLSFNYIILTFFIFPNSQ